MVLEAEEEVGGGEFEHLPEGCIANIVSFTTPPDACVLSLVSSSFRSASVTDFVWERFLPSDYQAIISQSSKPSTLTNYSSKKDLYLHLCHNPLLIDAGKKVLQIKSFFLSIIIHVYLSLIGKLINHQSFALDKLNGKICYMLSARSLSIVWGDTPRYWRWTSVPAAR